MPTPSKVATKAARGGSKAKSAKAKASAPAGAAPAPATPPATEPIPLPSEQSGELFLARIPGAPAPGPAFAATEAPAPAPTNAPAPALTAVPSAPAVGPTAAVPPAMAPLAVVPSAATPTEPTPTAPTQTTVASTAAVLAAPAPAPAAAPEQAAPLKETKRDRMAREQAEREATMRLLRKKGTAASDSSTLDMPSSSTPSSSSKPKSRPRSPPSGGSSGSGGGGKWDAEYPGKDPKLSGHLSRPFSPGWGDSRSLPPFMQEEEHSPVAEAEDEAFRLAVRSVPTAQLSGHLLSPRSRPRHGGFFPSDAYIAFVEEGELALRGDSPRPEASMMVVVRKPLQLATVDTMQIGPVSPGAPGTEQRQRFIQTYSGRAGENASSRGSASKRSSPGRPPTAAGSPVGAGGVVNDSGAASSCPPTAVTLRKPRVPSPPPAADGSRSPSRRGEGLAQQVKLQSHWRVGLGGGAYSMHGPHMSTPPPAPTTQAPPPPLLGTSPELGPPRSERLKSERARRRGARGAREAPQPRTPVTPATVGFRITVRDLCAYAVPDADGDGQSEPYVRVELLGVDDVHLTTHVIASASTSVATDSPLNPVWGRDDTMTIDLPPDTPAALAIFGGNWPFVRVSIYDRDQLDEDDLLGEAELLLESKEGSFERHSLRGAGPYPDCSFSLSYDIMPYMPSPPAWLTVKDIKCGSIEAIGATLVQSVRAKSGLTGVHLRLTLVDSNVPNACADEVGSAQTAKSLAAHTSSTTASCLRWDDLEWPGLATTTLKLMVPKGMQRPPSLRVELCDDELLLPQRVVASGVVRLGDKPKAASSGSRKVVLVGGSVVRDVIVEFTFTLREMQASTRA